LVPAVGNGYFFNLPAAIVLTTVGLRNVT